MTVYGLGGCGKTAVAIEFAYRTIEKHPGCLIFWVPAINRESFELAYRELGILLQIPGITDDNADVKQLVYKEISKGSLGEWLMIVDNADDPQVLMGHLDGLSRPRRLIDYLPRSDQGSILFTTRNRKTAEDITQSNVFGLDDMNTAEAKQLLARRISNSALLIDQTAIDELLQLLTFLPLAIVQAVAFINRNDVSVSEYVSLFKHAGADAELFSEHFTDPSRYQEMESTIAKTWYISFDQIYKQDRLAADYLSFMACIDRVNIPQSLLPIQGSAIQRVKAIGTLKGYAFITERQHGRLQSNEEKFFDIHRLVHMASVWWLKEHGEWAAWTERAFSRLWELLPEDCYDKPEKWINYLPHAIYATVSLVTLSQSARGSLSTRIGYGQLTLGQYAAAQMSFREAISVKKETLGDQHPDTLTSMSNYAIVLEKLGKYQEAEIMHREILATRDNLLGKEHEDTLMSMNRIALVLYYQEKFEEAEVMQKHTLTIREKVLGKKHPDTLGSMNNLAVVLSKRGKLKEAEAIHKQMLATGETVLGQEHPNLLSGMHCSATVLEKLGEYEAAEAMFKQTLAKREKVLGIAHPDTLMSLYWLAYLLANQNRYDEATGLYERACTGYSIALGQEHSTTRACYRHYSQMLQSKEKDRLLVPPEMPEVEQRCT
jgi:tetratricopeptide (TPR) repeat protein